MDMQVVLIGIGAMTLVTLLVLIAVVVMVYLQSSKPGQGPEGIQPLNETLHQQQLQIAMLIEKINSLTPVNQNVNSLQSEIRGLTERISTVENRQSSVQQGVGDLATSSQSSLAELKSLTNQLGEVTAVMRSELAVARTDLTTLNTHARARQEMEAQTADSIHRLETIIAGTQTKGTAGENILELVFGKLPQEWQVRDFKVNGKPVEFGLRLPNNLILPIDSKWAATHLLEQFTAAEDPQEQRRLKKEIEDAVLQKAREVKKYIDPGQTVNFGVAVVPDSIFDLTYGVQPEAFKMNIVLISYSMVVPYLLLVFQTTLRSTQNVDYQKLEAYLQTVEESVLAIQDELDGRYSRAVTMLANSRDEIRALISKANSSLTALHLGDVHLRSELAEEASRKISAGDWEADPAFADSDGLPES